MAEKVLIISFTFEQEPDAFAELERAGLIPVVWANADRKGATQKDLAAYWDALPEKPAGIIMGADIEIGEEFMCASAGLHAISLNCAGYDHLDLNALNRHNIRVCNVPRQNFDAVADLAWGQILSLMRRIPEGDRNIRMGKWYEGMEHGIAVSKKTLGIVGLGAVGQAVARRAIGFDMDIIVSSTSNKPELAERYGLRYVDRSTLFSESDILVLCCPANGDTHHIINSEALGKMKKTAVIINPSRGGLIDTDALIKALKQNQIAGAALDVFEAEPLLKSELFELKNTVLTPHIGGLADREIYNVAVQSARNMAELLNNPDTGLKIV